MTRPDLAAKKRLECDGAPVAVEHRYRSSRFRKGRHLGADRYSFDCYHGGLFRLRFPALIPQAILCDHPLHVVAQLSQRMFIGVQLLFAGTKHKNTVDATESEPQRARSEPPVLPKIHRELQAIGREPADAQGVSIRPRISGGVAKATNHRCATSRKTAFPAPNRVRSA